MLHPLCFVFITADSLDLTIIGGNDSKIQKLDDCKRASLFSQRCQTLKGINK